MPEIHLELVLPDGRVLAGAFAPGEAVIDLSPRPGDPPPDPALVEYFRRERPMRLGRRSA